MSDSYRADLRRRGAALAQDQRRVDAAEDRQRRMMMRLAAHAGGRPTGALSLLRP